MDKKSITTDILGTKYMIYYGETEDRKLPTDAWGITNTSLKYIIITNDLPPAEIEEIQKRILRHELIHAFLTESGLEDSSHPSEAWALDEEMVDWFAIMSGRIFKKFQELNCL